MDCGFECLRHFNRRFKQLFGNTPGAYRLAQRRAATLAHGNGLALDPPTLVFHKVMAANPVPASTGKVRRQVRY